jgi:hypothetical protein
MQDSADAAGALDAAGQRIAERPCDDPSTGR